MVGRRCLWELYAIQEIRLSEHENRAQNKRANSTPAIAKRTTPIAAILYTNHAAQA